MNKETKEVELLILMKKAGLINVPKKVSAFTTKAMKTRGLEDKVKLVDAITDCKYGRSTLLLEPSIGPTRVAEMCWWAVYGKWAERKERMMTDQELIEAAAKVVGKTGRWEKGEFRLINSKGSYWTPWNPLTSNADAFRLMVDHELLVLPQGGHSVIVDWYGAGDAVEEPFNTDKHAATRRAIVRSVIEKALRKTQRKVW